MWGQEPVIPASQEVEAGESLGPGGRGCSELRSCHCIAAWATEYDSVSQKKKKKTLSKFGSELLGNQGQKKNMISNEILIA